MEQLFTTLGLKEEHLKVYLASLQWGETIITNIARKAGLPRTTVYSLLDELIELGIIIRSLRKSKTIYRAADPEYLKKLVQKRSEELLELEKDIEAEIPLLKAMQKGKKTPRIELLEGAEGIMQAYEKSLEAEEVWIQCYTDSSSGTVVPISFFEDYFRRLFSSKTRTKELITASPGDEEYIRKHTSEKNLHLMTEIEGQIDTDFMLYANTVIFVSFDEEASYALVIEDPHIANCMRSMFDLAWKQAAGTDPRVVRGEQVKIDF